MGRTYRIAADFRRASNASPRPRFRPLPVPTVPELSFLGPDETHDNFSESAV